MANLPIHWIATRAFCHATEEEDRVRRAVDFVLPGAEENRTVVEGQFGNPLIILSRRETNGSRIQRVWTRFEEAGILSRVRTDVARRLDEDGVLHLRLDKQTAFGEDLSLSSGSDAIDLQVKLKAFPANAAVLRRVADELVGAR
jgi:RNA-binding protein